MMQSSSLLGALALLAARANAVNTMYEGSYFTINPNHALVSTRLDPVMSPGVSPSNHLHNIFGGDKFSANWDYETAQTSQCNNIGPQADHSNYWFPALYYKGSGGYELVPTGLEVYYHFDTADNGPRTMFPPGFKMISGNAMLRSNDSLTDFSTASDIWWCHGPEVKQLGAFEGETFNNCNGADNLAAQLWFPFCWDGLNEFDPKDPYAHVVFGTHVQNGETVTSNQEGGKCPSTHPKALPQLFMEFHNDISSFAVTGGDDFVLAQGDPTGYGMHADFINGWSQEAGSLGDAISVDPNDPQKTKCMIGESGAPLSTCFTMLDDDTVSNCKIAPTINEPVTGPLPALPGCNPIQSGPAMATVQTNCAGYKPPTGAPAAPASSAPQPSSPASVVASAVASTVTTAAASTVVAGGKDAAPVSSAAPAKPSAPPSGGSSSPSSGSISVKNGSGATDTWTYQGCYTDLTPNRDVRSLGSWGTGTSATECANSCFSAGFKIAGAEYWNGVQCFCGNTIVSSTKVSDSDCSNKCDGGTCGGSSRLSVYAKAGTPLTKRSHKHRHVRKDESS